MRVTGAPITPATAASLVLHGAIAAALLLTLPGRNGMDAPAEQSIEVTLVPAEPPGAPPDSPAEALPDAPQPLQLAAPITPLPPDLVPNTLPEPIAPPAEILPLPDAVATLPAPPARPASAAPPRQATAPRPRAVPASVPAAGAATTPAAAQPGPPPLITEARYRRPPAPPVYPPPAISMGITGSVVLRALVGPDGDTQELRVWRSSGNPLLDNAALAAARRWAFAPALNGAHPIAAWVEVPVHFRLN